MYEVDFIDLQIGDEIKVKYDEHNGVYDEKGIVTHINTESGDIYLDDNGEEIIFCDLKILWIYIERIQGGFVDFDNKLFRF